MAGWTANLNAGMSRGDVVIGFSESQEHRGLTQAVLNQGLWVADAQALIIARLYDATFDRLPDSAGLIGWTASLRGGMPLSQIAAGFSDSAEFQSRYGALSNHDFVAQLFRFCLNREGDAAGIQNWVNNMDAGLRTRAQVLLEFSESQEHINLTTPNMLGGIQTFDYHSAPTPAVDDFAGKAVPPPLTLPSIHDDAALTGINVDDKFRNDGAQTLPAVLYDEISGPGNHVAFQDAWVSDAFVLPVQSDPSPSFVMPINELYGEDAYASDPSGEVGDTGSATVPFALAADPEWLTHHTAFGAIDDIGRWTFH